MRKYSRIFNYLKSYKSKIVLYFLCIILSVVFGIVSFAMLSPFFDLIFNSNAAKMCIRDRYKDLTNPSNPLNTLNTRISAVVPIMIAAILIHAMILIALVDFFALKYRQANRKYKFSV